jgi:hypothetical protein
MEKKMSFPIFAGETEQKVGPAIYVCNLADIGLGRSQGGIESNLEQSSYERYALTVVDALVPVEDKNHVACIDGRCTICQINGDDESVRMRIAGGILSYDIAALLSDSSLADSLSCYDSVYEKFIELEKFSSDTLGILPSSHTGGCGADDGLISHLNKIDSEEVESASVSVLELLFSELNTEQNQEDFSQLAVNAKNLAKELAEAGWDGKKYVQNISEQDESGVEKLETNPLDELNGHNEQAILLVKGNKTISKQKLLELGLGQAFVLNIDVIKRMSENLSGPDGLRGYYRAVQSLVAYQLAVAGNLCNKNMPIFIV